MKHTHMKCQSPIPLHLKDIIIIFRFLNNMENEAKDSREFKILYDWLQLTRKTNQSLRGDLKLMMDLIQIPISVEEVNFFMKIIDPNEKMNKLEEEDFLNAFIIPE